MLCTPHYHSGHQNHGDEWAGYVARMGETRGAYRILVGKYEGKRTFERPRRRWMNIIKMDL